MLKRVSPFKLVGLNLNKARELVFLISGGSEFQSQEAEWLKGLFSIMVRRAEGTIR